MDGVASPGQVLHVRDGVTNVIARRVPKDGFRISTESGTLTIWMQTYYSAEHVTRTSTGTTSVSLRN